ncbi:MAG: 4-hydroxy-tetrahydrodipicolinate reductase [Bacillota bacterium]
MIIKTCLLGLGRTGTVVAEQLLNSPKFELVSVVGKPGSSKVGRPLTDFVPGESDLLVADSTNLAAEIGQKHVQVAIDFTSPEATLKNAYILAEKGVNMVIGTTGFNNMQLYELKKLVQQYRIGLVYAPNISVGINLLLSICKTMARLIPNYDVEITESCHRNKKDSPSGTALKIASELSLIKGNLKGNKLKFGRKGVASRETGEIGIHSLRAGGTIGVHKVLFAGEADEIEITHRSYSRGIYAEGALKAASFINNLKGFFHMEDVLLFERMDRDLRVAANRLYLNFN